MAGTPNRQLISVEEAKLRLRDLARGRSLAGRLLTSPLVSLGALVIAGAWLGSRARRGEGRSLLASLASTVTRTGLASAPILAEHLARSLSHRSARLTPVDTSMQEQPNGQP